MLPGIDNTRWWSSMNFTIKQKIKSQTGASITFALLIFLVCAVISSVVLTAGTAASGRMSQMADTEQRYYSVTSAAQLLKKMIENDTVTVIKTKESETEKTQNNDGTITDGTISVKSDKTEFDLNGQSYGVIETAYSGGSMNSTTYTPGTNTGGTFFQIKDSLQTYAAFKFMFNSNIKSAPSGFNNADFTPIDGTTGFNISLNLKEKTGVPNSIAVNITESIKEDGMLEFIVDGNTNAAPASRRLSYKLKLVFEADKNEIKGERSEDGPLYDVSDGGKSFKYVSTTTETETTTIKWNLVSMAPTYD